MKKNIAIIPNKKNKCAIVHVFEMITILKLDIKIANQNVTVPVYQKDSYRPT